MKILKFQASWCQPCKMLSQQMEGLTFPHEVEVVDIDEQSDLATQYQIRGVPTMILVDNDGKEIKRVAGTQTSTQLQENFGAE